jgi:hypothetical protein
MEKHHAVASTRSETRNVQTSLPHQNILARRLLGGGIDAHIAHADDAKHKIAEFLDLDGDKRISYEEFVHSMAVQAIRDMDSDKDGISPRLKRSNPQHQKIPRFRRWIFTP